LTLFGYLLIAWISFTAVGSPALILAGVIASLSSYSFNGSLFLFGFVPAVPLHILYHWYFHELVIV
jgi:hypothetical protein